MLFYPNSFKLSIPSDREIQVERDFNAPRELVFDAFTKPELVRRWLLGPDGWTMPVCEIDLKVGGAYRYVWRKESTGHEMGMGGEFREIAHPEKLVATEKFDEAWYPGEAVDTTLFQQQGDITKITLTVLYQSKEAREAASRSGMEHGMAAGYSRLEEVLSSMIEQPSVAQIPARMAAIIHLTIPRNEIGSAMGPALGEIHSALAAQSIPPTGPWFTHHLKMDPQVFDFEVCVPIALPVSAAGRVVCANFPAIRVVRTIHRGAFDGPAGLAVSWGDFGKWIASEGHRTGPDLYECYLVGPDTTSNPADWRTELNKPLLD